MRIGVIVRFALEQAAALSQDLDHMGVGIEHPLAREDGCRGQETPVSPDGILHLESVTAPDDIVLQAVAGRGVNGAGPGIEGDVIAQDHRNAALIEGML